LTPHLAAHAADDCIAADGSIVTGTRDDDGRCFHGPISALSDLVRPPHDMLSTPSNVWPADRHWLLYTDWDFARAR
jgi:hypothetical protein